MRTVAIISAAIAMCLMAACSPKTVYVPVENATARTDTVMQTRLMKDSRVEKDSVLVLVRGDTVYIRETRRLTTETHTTDTVYYATHDTVEVSKPYPVEHTVEVERSRPWWEWVLITAGLAATAIWSKKLYGFVRDALKQI